MFDCIPNVRQCPQESKCTPCEHVNVHNCSEQKGTFRGSLGGLWSLALFYYLLPLHQKKVSFVFNKNLLFEIYLGQFFESLGIFMDITAINHVIWI